ncbi:MAG: hypothetical protein HC933_14920 [Pleurocapsa sp. SU_196_0]|nr:hypothetical protein [Pleurocapsa sp. SU_196_0]
MNADIISHAIYDIRQSISEAMITSNLTGPEGVVLVSYNANAAIGFAATLTDFVKDTLKASGFAALGRLQMARFSNNALGVTFVKGDYAWFMLLDLNKVSLGMVTTYVTPRATRALDAAIECVALEVLL